MENVLLYIVRDLEMLDPSELTKVYKFVRRLIIEIYDEKQEEYRERDELRAKLGRIASTAGHPDAEEACRLIIKECE